MLTLPNLPAINVILGNYYTERPSILFNCKLLSLLSHDEEGPSDQDFPSPHVLKFEYIFLFPPSKPGIPDERIQRPSTDSTLENYSVFQIIIKYVSDYNQAFCFLLEMEPQE